MSAERDRLERGAARARALAALGPVPQRARLGHRARGLQRRAATPGSFFPHDHARSRAYRWNEDGLGGHLRRPADALLRARVLERPRPDPQGADLRPHRARGQPRRGRQGVLVVPRLDADALVDALALHVPAGRVPVRRGSSPRTRARGKRRPRVRAPRHRRLRRRAATGRSPPTTPRPSPEDILHPGLASGTPGPRRRRSTCCRRSGSATPGRGAIDVAKPSLRLENGALVAEHHELGTRCLSASRLARGALLRERDERASGSGGAASRDAVSEGRHQRPRRPRRRRPSTREQTGHEGRVPLPPRGRRRRDGDDRAAPQPRRPGSAPTSTRSCAPARARGRRVLRRADARRRLAPTRRSCCARRSRGMLWSKQFYHYDVQRWLDGDPAGPPPPDVALERPQPRVDAPEQHGRHLDAGHVGVPLVRGLGPRLPLRRARARRPGVREGAAHPALPRVVHAPERPAARLRVGVRRRQPAGARVGGAARLRDRRRRRPRLPRAHLPQAAPELHLVGEPQGRRGQQRLRGRLPRPRQHRPVRPLGAAGQRAGSSSPTARPGWRCTARTCSRSRCCSPSTTRPTRTSRRSSSSTSR